MKDGFFRVSAVTPKIRVADPVYNREEICKLISEGHGSLTPLSSKNTL